ncbi:unnamed protein product, partial [marine sediment metagenome]
MEQLLVSVIIPSKDSKNTLIKVLEALLLQTWENFEVIVIDDGSNDYTSELFCSNNFKLPKFKYYRFNENLGRSKARNMGLNLSQGDLLLFLDADCLPADENFIYQHIVGHKIIKNCALIGNIKVYPSIYKDNKFARYVVYRSSIVEKRNIEYCNVPYRYFSSANVSILRKNLPNNILFDESIIDYGWEDRDFGFKLKNLGLKFAFSEKALVYHLDYDASLRRQCEREYNLGKNVAINLIEKNKKLYNNVCDYLGPYLYLEPIHFKNDSIDITIIKIIVRIFFFILLPISS